MILVKLILYFIVVVGVLYLAYQTTKLIGKNTGISQASANLQILERVAVAKDCFLVIAKVQDQILVLGVTPGGIEKIQELDEYKRDVQGEEHKDFAAVLAQQIRSSLPSGRKKK